MLLGERLAEQAAVGATHRLQARIEPCHQRGADDVQAGPLGNRHELLPADALPAGLDAALVVPGTRPTEARLDGVVRGQCQEAWRQLAVAADQVLLYRRLEVVVRTPLRCRAEV